MKDFNKIILTIGFMLLVSLVILQSVRLDNQEPQIEYITEYVEVIEYEKCEINVVEVEVINVRDLDITFRKALIGSYFSYYKVKSGTYSIEIKFHEWSNDIHYDSVTYTTDGLFYRELEITSNKTTDLDVSIDELIEYMDNQDWEFFYDGYEDFVDYED